MKKIITISGSSGVGKTTLSDLLCIVLGSDIVTIINGDDAHRWERSSTMWEYYTHLNPEANNLKHEFDCLSALRDGKCITREKYNHDTGQFDTAIKICSNDYILYEGLHALYGDINTISDMKIYVETEQNLKKQWKLNRDTQKRGYTKEQVEKCLTRREMDERLFISPQKENADIVVRFNDKRDSSVHLEYQCFDKSFDKIMKRIKNLYDLHRGFLSICKKSAFEYDLVQDAGGNVSYKFENLIIITSSGRSMNDVTMLNGFSVCDLQGFKKNKSSGKPSMEIGLHIKIKHPIVFHTHPIYLNTILCSKDSEQILCKVLKEYDYDYIPYKTPGNELKDFFNPTSENSIFLLENHGLICAGSSFVEVFNLSLHLNELCKQWLIKNSETFKTFLQLDTIDDSGYLFPDAVVLEDQMKPINHYILQIQKDIGLSPRFLNQKNINDLLNMEEEKYRKNLR